MILTVLGASGSVPGPTSPCSCYLLERDGYRLLLDLGTGALGGVLARFPAREVDAVVVSHWHSDHSSDVPALGYAQRNSGAPRREPTVVLGPPGHPAALGDLEPLRLMTPSPSSGPLRLGPFSVWLAAVRHQVPAYAIRVEAGGRSVTYTGDTGPCSAVLALAEGCGVLLAEAALEGSHGGDPAAAAHPAGFDDDPGCPPVPPHHLTAAQAGELARRCRAALLVLTHLRPWAEPAAALAAVRTEYSGALVAAATGLRVAV